TGMIVRTRALMVDDQSCFVPRLNSTLCYQVLPFERVEDFKRFLRHLSGNALLRFQVCDRLWRIISHPFAFLNSLLQAQIPWRRLRTLVNLEYRLAQSVCCSTCPEDVSALVSSIAEYRQYLSESVAVEAALRLSRHEHQIELLNRLIHEH